MKYDVVVKLVVITTIPIKADSKTQAKELARDYSKKWWANNFPKSNPDYRIVRIAEAHYDKA